MKKLLSLTSMAFLCLSLNNSINAQSFEAGLFVGSSLYNGDVAVTSKNFLPQMRQTVGVFGRYSFNNSFALKGQVFYGQIFANEKKYPISDAKAQRGFSFNTTLTEYSVQAEWSFLNLDRGFSIDNDDPFLSVYAFGGAGLTTFDPSTDYNEPNLVERNIALDKNAKFLTTAMVFPFGAGVKMNLNSLTVALEHGIRKTNTDHLDGISHIVNSKVTDYYIFTGLTISYHFTQDGIWTGSGYNAVRGRSGCPTF